MKNILNKIPPESKIAILIAVLIAIIAQVFMREFPLQYMENGEVITEVFSTPQEFNNRAAELKADSIKYWLE